MLYYYKLVTKKIAYLASWKIHWQQNENKGWIIEKKIQKIELLTSNGK